MKWKLDSQIEPMCVIFYMDICRFVKSKRKADCSYWQNLKNSKQNAYMDTIETEQTCCSVLCRLVEMVSYKNKLRILMYL